MLVPFLNLRYDRENRERKIGEKKKAMLSGGVL